MSLHILSKIAAFCLLACSLVMGQTGQHRKIFTSGGGGGPAFVKVCSTNQTSNVASVTVTCAIAAGHQIAFFGGYNSTTAVPACSDSAGDTFTAPSTLTGGSNALFSCYLSSFASTSGATSVTVTYTAATTFCTCVVVELSGVTALSAANVSGALIAGTSYTWNSITTTGSNSIVLAFACNGSQNDTYTAGGSYTIPASGQISGGGQSAMLEYQASLTAGAQTPTATGTATITVGSTAIAFK